MMEQEARRFRIITASLITGILVVSISGLVVLSTMNTANADFGTKVSLKCTRDTSATAEVRVRDSNLNVIGSTSLQCNPGERSTSVISTAAEPFSFLADISGNDDSLGPISCGTFAGPIPAKVSCPVVGRGGSNMGQGVTLMISNPR